MSLRIGYVNVQGLSPDKFEVCCRLLDTIYDLLFVAETWFVNHRDRKHDRRFLASTPKPRHDRGRPSGGIYLLGTKHARSGLSNLNITPYSITFTAASLRISGVYFPPTTMTSADVESHLRSLHDSSVVMGDINVRFQNTLLQDGAPGPPRRMDVFTRWLNETGRAQAVPITDNCTGLSPIISHPTGLCAKFTLDHCFVRHRLLARSQLRLLDRTQLSLRTDHRYIIHLSIGQAIQQPLCRDDPIRYHVRKLKDKTVTDRIPAVMNAAIQAHYKQTDDVDDLNTMLTHICQSVAQEVCGSYKPSEKKTSAKAPRKESNPSFIRQYKEAMQTSMDNGPILPTSDGIDAMMENFQLLKNRYSAEATSTIPHHSPPRVEVSPDTWKAFFSGEKITTEITSQQGEKSCGSDGIHIRLLKSFRDTGLIPLLETLFLLCMQTGRTPKAWNQSEIHLLTKDPKKRRDANNLRPITIICMFRKIFERLLLDTFDEDGWARVHPAQAGFRGGYSVTTNAAVVHHLLSTGRRTAAIFLDLRAAFDVVDHNRLRQLLIQRGCPSQIVNVINSLMLDGVWSRLLINDGVSPSFQRTRGVFQGSPLSPALFNIFIDDLLHLLNADATDLRNGYAINPPSCLFYADDGVILVRDLVEAQRLLDIAEAWTREARLTFNVKKCAVISLDKPQLLLQGEPIPVAECYTYLGFPITQTGIDFVKHLNTRIGAAVKRCDFLTLHSDSWGVANRLRVYNQHLAPMFEFGAPLVESWRCGSKANKQAFAEAFKPWGKLMTWINGGSKHASRLTANLLGLIPCADRFQQLKTQYQLVIGQLSRDNPLSLILGTNTYALAFIRALRDDQTFDDFLATASLESDLKPQLQTHLLNLRRDTIQKESQKAKMTRIIPLESRKVPGLFLADITLAAPIHAQRMLLAYRRNCFGQKKKCPCGTPYLRTHEICSHLPHPVRLTREERAEKTRMFSRLDQADSKVTDLDYLLNKGRLEEVIKVLTTISLKLGEAYHQEQSTLAHETA
jgi:Reverse transcriptase (RNA-dependent DNA polymerase)